MILLPIALIKPSFILRSTTATRKKALLIFGGGALLFLILGVATDPQDKKSDVAGVNVSQTPTPTYTPTPTPENKNLQQANVVRVIDGDTINVSINGKNEVIRLIGIDTPEVVDPRKPVQCFGKDASNKAKELLAGKNVMLEVDSTQGERDKYNRLLRYLFLENGTNFNKMMISEGYAHEYTYQSNPYKYQKEFKEAERQARENNKGLWNPASCTTPTPTKSPVRPTTVPTSTYTAPTKAVQQIVPPANNSGGFSCDCSKTCAAMSSCSEAQYQLNSCGCSARDADGDGIACDSNCQ